MKRKMKKSIGLLAVALLAGTLSARAATAKSQHQTINPEFLESSAQRDFIVNYTAKINDIPVDTRKLRVWLPVPIDSTVQTIKGLAFSKRPQFGFEKKYGNKIAYFEFDNPNGSIELTMDFTASRKEVRMDLDKLATDGKDRKGAHQVFLEPDALVLVDDEMCQLASRITAGKETTLDKAKAIYDYVLGKMTYDKQHAGWGLGSTRHACDVGLGNCTDFHALFNSLCRAEGIASGFEIGLYLPYEKKSTSPLGGYHCWALFRVPGKSWVPVDCSEADRIPEYRELFFGGHSSNRVTLSTGRDITLVPKQAGSLLNYFLNPYAEADGKPVKTSKTWTYQDLN